MRQTDSVAQPRKSGRKSDRSGPFKKGPDPRRGRGPKKGAPNAGRPPGGFLSFLAGIRDGSVSQAALERAAQDENCRHFGTAWKIAADYDTERPAEKHQIVGPVEVRVSFAREGRRTTSS